MNEKRSCNPPWATSAEAPTTGGQFGVADILGCVAIGVPCLWRRAYRMPSAAGKVGRWKNREGEMIEARTKLLVERAARSCEVRQSASLPADAHSMARGTLVEVLHGRSGFTTESSVSFRQFRKMPDDFECGSGGYEANVVSFVYGNGPNSGGEDTVVKSG
jgi:hypothetical protein